MTVRGVMVCLVVMCVAVSTTVALAGPRGDANTKYEQGNKLLRAGDFQGALKAYDKVAQANPKNPKAKIQSMLVRRIVKMRQSLDGIKNNQQWFTTAKSLYSFYYDYQIYSEAVNIARKIHNRNGTTESAVMLARSRLALGKNRDAMEGLRAISNRYVTPSVRVLMCIAQARLGQTNNAKALLRHTKIPRKAEYQYLFDLSRLCALAGNYDQALTALTFSFENTPVGRLVVMKNNAKNCQDFARLWKNPDFANVMMTKSKNHNNTLITNNAVNKAGARNGVNKRTSHPRRKTTDNP